MCTAPPALRRSSELLVTELDRFEAVWVTDAQVEQPGMGSHHPARANTRRA